MQEGWPPLTSSAEGSGPMPPTSSRAGGIGLGKSDGARGFPARLLIKQWETFCQASSYAVACRQELLLLAALECGIFHTRNTPTTCLGSTGLRKFTSNLLAFLAAWNALELFMCIGLIVGASK
ncbi:Protein of unknown function, partial [Gryllus bimaculatus]